MRNLEDYTVIKPTLYSKEKTEKIGFENERDAKLCVQIINLCLDLDGYIKAEQDDEYKQIVHIKYGIKE